MKVMAAIWGAKTPLSCHTTPFVQVLQVYLYDLKTCTIYLLQLYFLGGGFQWPRSDCRKPQKTPMVVKVSVESLPAKKWKMTCWHLKELAAQLSSFSNTHRSRCWSDLDRTIFQPPSFCFSSWDLSWSASDYQRAKADRRTFNKNKYLKSIQVF